ncbi:DUF547 domain-containing protein [Lacinutrix sp. Bg11-31]|uniref:DUF547 domain-containing protein n=1 Tax=Lacinutrix sp. Bg11-31 TaxID=2057808 RepID=UPI000C31417E|nr:DUF547 domain-containing protein [Lacinutrix sp. Bg11-31]AUC82502.1 DUF547 domain-containing protein [Lacinutrix sp. Bg11-31]
MKHLILLVFALVLSSCFSTKKIAESTPKEEPKQVIEVKTETAPQAEETPVTIAIPEEAEVTPEVKETVVQETIIASPEAFSHNEWNKLLKQHVSEAGNVDYKSIKTNRKSLTNYIISLGENIPNDTWKKENKLVYWINAYNALTVDLILRNYPLQSIKDIKNPWEQRLWKLGNKWYSLEEIEHQILRKMDEPRIHFAIVCASYSCPKLQNEAFTASNLEAQLTNATKQFLSDKNRNDISQNNLKLSRIFKWFKKDFEQNGSLINFLNTYSDVSISEKANKSYLDYNWNLND